MTDFTIQIQNFAKKAIYNAHIATREAVIDVITDLDARSPVGDPSLWMHKPPPHYKPGHFRGNWQVGVDNEPTGELDLTWNMSGKTTVADNIRTIPTDAFGHAYYIVNNVPYARRIEDGWSKQAPMGLVTIVAAKWEGIVMDSAEKAQSGQVMAIA